MMNYNSDIHNRRSIRLQDYDYSQAGVYFVTICIQNHKCLLGEIINSKIILHNVGEMIKDEWYKIVKRYHNIEHDEFIIMPNHLHGIIIINNNNENVGTSLVGVPDAKTEEMIERTGIKPVPALGNIIGAFKSISTNRYIYRVKNYIWPSFYKRLWQLRYYDRIVRNEIELNKIRKYIIENPLKWEDDKYHPDKYYKNNKIWDSKY